MFKVKEASQKDNSIAIIDLPDETVARITKFSGNQTDSNVGHIVIRKGKALVLLTSESYWEDYYSITKKDSYERANYRCEILPNGFELVVSQSET